MKIILKIFARYAASAAGIALFLLALNFAVLIAWAVYSSNIEGSKFNSREIASNLTRHGEVYEMSETGMEMIEQQYQWAMLLDDSGNVVWSENLPAELPLHYSAPEVASFSRWYLNDYPVHVWRHLDGLLVLGSPEGSIWKHGMEMPEIIMANVPVWLAAAVILNCIAAILLAFLSSMRLFRSLRPIIKGIEDIAANKPAALSTGGILGDLAEKLNRTSAQLKKQENALQKRDNARTQWIVGVSHDIRTPLSMVMGYASQLEENSLLPQAEREQAGVIRRQSEKIKKLVDDLNLASKLEYDMQPLRMEHIYPAELVRSVVTDFLNSGLDARYSLELMVEKEAQSLAIAGDEGLLRRAIANLLNNSIQHNPDGCAISVLVEKSLPHCAITVSDDGMGFPEAMLETLSDSEKTAGIGNQGLGLTIVKQIIRAHGGAIEFNNLPRSACAVKLYLPVVIPSLS
jgi:signal transduction histidine kinase